MSALAEARAGESPVIAVEARITPVVQGGVEQVVVGLAHGLSALTDGNESYVFVTTEDDDWLRPHVNGPCEIVHAPVEEVPLHSRVAERLPRLASIWGHTKRLIVSGNAAPAVPPPAIPSSDGTVERLGASVVHFTMQVAYLTSVPSIYQPHDLQHLHFPEFFSPEAIAWRELNYRAFCKQARMVTVTTQWGKRDLTEHYGLPADKVVVIPLAPAISNYENLSPGAARAILDGMHIPERYAYYPAQTWPHKNHLRLVEALYEARECLGVEIPLVCSGLQNEHYSEIRERIEVLGMQDLVRFVGFVQPRMVAALYQCARLVVFPSLFEAAGGFGPMFEAFEAGTPVVASSATSLPEQAGDAAVIFDPFDVDAIAGSVARVWQDDDLRTILVERGRARVAGFSWDGVARTFRAHYRRIAGWPLDEQDIGFVGAETPF